MKLIHTSDWHLGRAFHGAGLLPAHQRDDVLNGIAYDAATKRLFVTGKLWPRLFEIQLTAPR